LKTGVKLSNTFVLKYIITVKENLKGLSPEKVCAIMIWDAGVGVN
jgi:hypothetical protein